mgnify:FL=1
MSNNNSLSYKRAARILTVACGLLFSIFSIVYLFVLQKDVVGALHYSLSGRVAIRLDELIGG